MRHCMHHRADHEEANLADEPVPDSSGNGRIRRMKNRRILRTHSRLRVSSAMIADKPEAALEMLASWGGGEECWMDGQN